jgi:hypothetical protein
LRLEIGALSEREVTIMDEKLEPGVARQALDSDEPLEDFATENVAKSGAEEKNEILTRRGSPGYFEDDPDRLRWSKDTVAYASHDYRKADGTYSFTIERGREPKDEDGVKRVHTIRRCRLSPGDCLEPEDKAAFEKGYYSGRGDEEPVLYRLPELLKAIADRGPKNHPRIEICEGESDADIGAELGLTTTSAPFGVTYWRPEEWNAYFADCDVGVCIDNDERWRQRAWKLHKQLKGIAKSLRVVEFAPHKDMKAWVQAERDAGKSDEAILAAYVAKRTAAPTSSQWTASERRQGRDYSRSNNSAERSGNGRCGGDGLFRRDGNRGIIASQENILVALDLLRIKLSFDRFANRGLIEGDLFETKSVIDDSSIVRLWMEIEARYGFRAGKDYFWCFIIDQARQNSFHPVQDYFKGLTWDQVPRLDTWLINWAGAEDTPYIRAVSAKPLLAAVRRVRRPGVKFDEMLVLEAPQGYNRSSALRILAVNDDWFTDDIPSTLTRRLSLRG